MTWATNYIARLCAGETISFRPRGNSMVGRIESGQLVTVEPVTLDTELVIDDIVLCKVAGNDYLHLISAIDLPRYQISNNRGYINGWTNINKIYGKVIKIE